MTRRSNRVALSVRIAVLGVAGLLSVATSAIHDDAFSSRQGPALAVDDASPNLATHVTAAIRTEGREPDGLDFVQFEISGELNWVPETPGTGGTAVTVRLVPDDANDPIEERQLFVSEGGTQFYTMVVDPMSFPADGVGGATFEVELGDGPVGQLDVDWHVSVTATFVAQSKASSSDIVITFDDFDSL